MKSMAIPRIEADSLTQRVYRDLRQAVITGDIPGGMRLVESTIAQRMGVSRTPVREALQRLALEGLVYSIPRAGYIVEELSQEDIEDLFTTRMAIEKLVAERALKRITPQELGMLRKNLERTDELIKGGRTENMMDLDIEFHNIIYRASRSKTLYQICKTISDRTLRFRLACIHIPEIARRARNDHRRIYRAMESGDSRRVDESIRSHIRTVKKDILAFLDKSRLEAFLQLE
ncbi:MAG: GntR family transcriptional regulator [Deltaproteobacteria bacterium]|nr:GntR family transcriptional regulator [Deltaproteobacteria bacterium]